MTDARNNLTAAIAKIDRDILTYNEPAGIIAETGALFAAGKLDQADLDKAIYERDRLIARRKALHDALVAQAAVDAHAQAADIEKARKAAATASKKGASELADLDAQAGKHIDALVACLQQRAKVAGQLSGDLYDAGLREHSRTYLLDARHLSGYLADRLTRTGVSAMLEFIEVNGTQHFPTDRSLAEVAAERADKLMRRIAA